MAQARQLVIRITPRRLLGICIVAIFVAGAFGAAHIVAGIFGTQNVTMADSNSPDGLHRVVVIEEQAPGKVTTHIKMFRRSSDHWTARSEELVGHDSAGCSNYSIVWTLDAHNAPTGVKVFGDPPPYHGDPAPIFAAPLP